MPPPSRPRAGGRPGRPGRRCALDGWRRILRLGEHQRDTELTALAGERWELRELPEYELDELARIYRDRGLPPDLARQVAVELSRHDALTAHAEAELGLDAREQA